MRFYTLCVALLALACGTTPKSKKPVEQNKEQEVAVNEKKKEINNYLSIEKIDNKVQVYMDDSLVFDSGYTTHDQEAKVQIAILPEAEKLKIVLYNGIEPYDKKDDPYWEIMYDVVLDGEIVDFVDEYNHFGDAGKVYEAEYVIEDWKF